MTQVYEREVIMNAAEQIFNRLYPHIEIEDPLHKIFKNDISQIFKNLFTDAYINGLDRSDPDMQILLTAYQQLKTEGFVGKK